jgi:hypothetical protein
MWPCISFSDEKCSSKFNDLKTVSISDTVPKKNVKSALGSMKANGFHHQGKKKKKREKERKRKRRRSREQETS